jgi:hypothetical protein
MTDPGATQPAMPGNGAQPSAVSTTDAMPNWEPPPGPSIPPSGRLYAEADYLYWFTRPTKLPPLVIEGNPAVPGAIPAVGQPGTTVLIGDKQVDAAPRSGVRFRAGYWLDQDEKFGVEASGFVLENIGSTFAVSPDPAATLGLSFRDATVLSLNDETSLLFAAPNQATGAAAVRTETRFWGAEVDALCHMTGGSWYRADAIFGIRYLRLEESLDQTATSAAVSTPDGFVTFQGATFTAPATLTIADRFRTTNEFVGGQVGGHVLLQKGIWSADLRATIAPGVTHEMVHISGATTLSGATTPTPNGLTTLPGGLLSQVTNLGTHASTKFNLVPEAGASVGCQLTSYLRVTIGYTAIYWQEGVVRPATEIDRLVNSTLIPVNNPTTQGAGPLRPLPQVRAVDFWAQGVHAGLELDF